MKVLLLHPEDEFSAFRRLQPWDLVVDLGLAPPPTYEEWSREAGCRVVSLNEYACGFDDLYRLKEISHCGLGLVLDKHGIDWWAVLLPMLLPDMERALLLSRLAREFGQRCQMYHSRPDPRSLALQEFLGVQAVSLADSAPASLKLRHYREVFSRFDWKQLTQIAWDKFDPEHVLRRRLAGNPASAGGPEILLPTAYINVSRTAVAYANLLPDVQFLLAVARPGGRLRSLPRNVRMLSLDGYFGTTDSAEMSSLLEKWSALRRQMVSSGSEFQLADSLGMFQRVPGLMRWSIAARDAWARLLSSRTIVGCLSADDSNPYTSLPLHLASALGIPTVAVHHGALDYRVAVKGLHAEVYLAKGELERNYLIEKARIPSGRIEVGAPTAEAQHQPEKSKKSWLVFFTEPYPISGWRELEIYRGLLPGLLSLSERTGFQLVFKLHPFESIKGQRNLLSKLLTLDQLSRIKIVEAPLNDNSWAKIGCALTFGSSVALECAMRSVPIFLCGWMQTPHGGYLEQYEKFGIGHILASPSQLQNVPQLLENWKATQVADKTSIWRSMDPRRLRALLTATGRAIPAAVQARTAS